MSFFNETKPDPEQLLIAAGCRPESKGTIIDGDHNYKAEVITGKSSHLPYTPYSSFKINTERDIYFSKKDY